MALGAVLRVIIPKKGALGLADYIPLLPPEGSFATSTPAFANRRRAAARTSGSKRWLCFRTSASPVSSGNPRSMSILKPSVGALLVAKSMSVCLTPTRLIFCRVLDSRTVFPLSSRKTSSKAWICHPEIMLDAAWPLLGQDFQKAPEGCLFNFSRAQPLCVSRSFRSLVTSVAMAMDARTFV